MTVKGIKREGCQGRSVGRLVVTSGRGVVGGRFGDLVDGLESRSRIIDDGQKSKVALIGGMRDLAQGVRAADGFLQRGRLSGLIAVALFHPAVIQPLALLHRNGQADAARPRAAEVQRWPHGLALESPVLAVTGLRGDIRKISVEPLGRGPGAHHDERAELSWAWPLMGACQ